MKRRYVVGAATAGVLLAGAVAVNVAIGDVVTVFTSGSAKMLCTDIFVAGRDPALAWRQDFKRLSTPGKYLGVVKPKVDLAGKTVTASLWGYKTRAAIFRQGIGCTAAEGASVAALRAQGQGVATALPRPDPDTLWPEGGATQIGHLPPGVDGSALTAAIDKVFTESDPARPINTRGVVIIYKGRIIGERYGEGFDTETAHLSNSVAKSVTATLIGILVGQGRLDLNKPAPIAEWGGPGDPRGAITLDNLMRMSSGLQFEESYSKVKSDITMQYVGGDLAGYSAAKPLEVPPGTRWQYSTGTSNILGRIVTEAAGPDLPTAFAFPRKALFEPLGMRTAVFEPDAAGNLVGGSSFYASARDYGRLGLLYLNDGLWDGKRILPEGWVDYVRRPTPGSDGRYGAQFWLRGKHSHDLGIPPDMFNMNGHQGQHVVIIPSRDLVVVRVGLSEFDTWDATAFVADVLRALPAPSAGKGRPV
ncbi:MAG TPA: serine hydrolase [Caulobacter sp.]|nr:serine hydrolase [Caulobacter sp.]